MDWYNNPTSDLREVFRERTIQLCEEWKKQKAAKETAKEERSTSKDKDTKPVPETIEDSDDEIEVSEVKPASKASTRGAAKTTGKAARLRG